MRKRDSNAQLGNIHIIKWYVFSKIRIIKYENSLSPRAVTILRVVHLYLAIAISELSSNRSKIKYFVFQIVYNCSTTILTLPPPKESTTPNCLNSKLVIPTHDLLSKVYMFYLIFAYESCHNMIITDDFQFNTPESSV